MVREVLPKAYIHTINAAEVIRKFVREGVPGAEAKAMIEDLAIDQDETFSLDQAAAVGEFLGAHAELGLSLGDGVCLVMGLWNGSTVITADRAWAALHGKRFSRGVFKIHVIR
jgi:PIN domain nuclease of toxin-antitoxin system